MRVLLSRFVCVFALLIGLSGCIGTIVDTAVDTTVAVAKVPIKVAGAVIDAATKDDKDKTESSDQQAQQAE